MATTWKQLIKRWVPPAAVDLVRNPTALPPPGPFDLPAVTLGELFPGAERAEVMFPASQIARTRSMVLPLPDLLTVAAICRQLRPMRVFEIGTYTGSTTLVMGLNVPEQAEVFTLDLDPADLPAFLRTADGGPTYQAGSLYRGTAAAGKIRQLYGRSEGFDYSPYYGTIDLVYIDADHGYEAVKRDSKTAFRLVRPGGLVVWDDYRWLPEHHECAGVTRCLNELPASYGCRQLDGTRLAVARPGSLRTG